LPPVRGIDTAAAVVATLVRLLIAIALAIGALPLAWVVLEWALRHARWPLPDTVATLGGGALGLAWMLWRKPNWFWHTAVHELCHLVTCWLLWVKVSGISISDGKGGAVEHVETDPLRSTLIAIAPYTLPLVLLPALVARHWFVTDPGPWRTALSALCAFLFATHLHGLFHNVRINITGDQADLVKVGRPLSLVLIALVLVLVTAWGLRALSLGADSGF
jgi:hypothetical protein